MELTFYISTYKIEAQRFIFQYVCRRISPNGGAKVVTFSEPAKENGKIIRYADKYADKTLGISQTKRITTNKELTQIKFTNDV